MYQHTTLPNGLRVATEALPGMESATVMVTVDVGARFEREEEGGLSHLLEHMAFKGTARRSAQRIAEEMDMIGGNMNAYTSLENTVYYCRVLAGDVPFAVDMLADILLHSTFAQEELAREQGVILQEIAMHQDMPDDLILDYFSETAYPGQPLGRSILGTRELVSSYTRDDLARYMGTHYHAPSMVVSAAGKVDHDAFVQLAGAAFASLPSSVPVSFEQAAYKGGEKRTRRKLEQLHLMLGFETVSFHDPDYYAWQVLATLLGGGLSSRLFQEVREKRGLAYTVQAFQSSYADSGIFGMYAATSEDKASGMLEVVCAELAKLAEGVGEDELKRARNQIKAGLLMSRESSSQIAEWMGRHLLCYGRYRTAPEITQLIDAITLDDMKRLGASIAGRRGTMTFTALGPQKKLIRYNAMQKLLA